MSHHLESPLSQQDSRLDVTDHFVFRGESGTVLVMDVNSSAAGPVGKPGFHPEARYEFKIHLDGAPVEGVTYRATFGEADQDGEQAVALYLLTGPEASDDGAAGEMIAQGRTHSAIQVGNGMRFWAGKAADPFYIDLQLLQAVGAAVKNGARLDLGGWRPEAAKNDFAGATIHAIVLEIPDGDRGLGIDQRIGTWITTKLATDAGGWRPINRKGHPMVWPIFRQLVDSEWSSEANTGRPETDLAKECDRIARLVAGLVAANGTAADPAAYGTALARRLMPDVLPYQTGTAASYGFLGFNGRAMADNAPEVMFSLAMNSAVSTGLGAEEQAAARSDRFPYVVPAGR